MFDSLLYGMSTGTLRNYYKMISYNNLDIVTVNMPSSLGWTTAPQTYAYYVNGQNGTGTYPHNSQKLVEDVIASLDGAVDFSQYDNDHDGYVDALFVIHSGPGAEYTGNNNDIWSHSWNTNTPQLHDGVNVYRYSIEPEYWAAPGDMTCGVFAHELGHAAFGLPDLYDTDYSSEGLGDWSLMAGGSWNGSRGLGDSPSFPDAWSHFQMGYMTPTNVTTDLVSQSVVNAENTPMAYRLWTNGIAGNEYYLIQNRQQTGYDTYVPGSGMLIFHVDESVTTENQNEWYPGHTTTGHYLVALEQADGMFNLEHNTNRGDAGDPYPGTSINRNFTSSTLPNSYAYSGAGTNVKVQNIFKSGLSMIADLSVGIITGRSVITVRPDTIAFGLAAIGYTKYDTIYIGNGGALPLLVTGITSTQPVFSPAVTSFTVATGSIHPVAVAFSPVSSGTISANLSITSNDSIRPSVTVGLKGQGYYPPSISVIPDSFTVALASGDSTVQSMILKNTGTGDLNWNTGGGTTASPASLDRAIKEYHLTTPTLPFVSNPDIHPSPRKMIQPDIGKNILLSRQNLILRLASLNGVKVLFDYAHGNYEDTSSFAVYLSDLRSRGALINRNILPWTSSLLSSYNLIYIAECTGTFTPDELTALKNWVSNGGGLILEGDQFSGNLSSHVSTYGIQYLNISGTAGFTKNIVSHPVTNGCDTIYIEAPLNSLSTTTPAQTIVSDIAHVPHIAVSQYGSGRVVVIADDDFYDGIIQQGDNRTLANRATDWLVGGGNFWSVAPSSGIVAPGGSQSVNVRFDAKNLNGGDYRQVISINSNDPVNNPKNVPLNLHVVGVPAITVLPDTIKSGQVYVGVHHIDTLKVKSVGTDILTISNISSSNTAFTVDKTNFSISPGQENVIAVTFTPTQDTTYTGSLSITSNDGRHPVVTVGLKGSGMYPPVITVIPDSFAVALASGDSTTQTMTIGNIGTTILNWNSSVISPNRDSSLFTQIEKNSRSRVNIVPKWLVQQIVQKGTDNHYPAQKTGTTAIANGMIHKQSRTGISETIPLFGIDQSGISQINPVTGVKIHSVPLAMTSSGPHGLCYDGSVIYFIDGYGLNRLVRIDPIHLSIIDTVKVDFPGYIDGLATNGKFVYALDYTRHVVYEVDVASKTLLRTLNFNLSIGGGMTYAANRHSFFIGNFNYMIYEVDAIDGHLIDSISTSIRPYGVGYSCTGNVLFVGDYGSQTQVLNPNTGEIISSFSIGYDGLASDESQGSGITLVPFSGSVAAGSSQNIKVKFDASNMNGGDYRQVISITSNDPLNNPKNVPTKMHVVGVPAISVFPDTIKSGQVYIGVYHIDTLKVKNVGTDILNISNISSNIPVFTVDKTNFSLSPGQENVVAVTFTPTQDTTYSGSLSITSNDGRHPVVTVGLRGSGLYPPVITVTPDSFAVTLNTGDTTNQTMSIGNSGGSVLNWNANRKENSSMLKQIFIPKPRIIPTQNPTNTPLQKIILRKTGDRLLNKIIPNDSFVENFETGNLDSTKWTLNSDHSHIVTSATAANNTIYSLEQTRLTSTTVHFDGVSANFPDIQPKEVSFWIRVGSGMLSSGNAAAYFVLGDSAITSNLGAFWFFANGDGHFQLYPGDASVPYTTNTWYHIQFLNINWSAKTFDYYVNGILVASGLLFRATSTVNFSQVHLYNYSPNIQAWWDEISIGGQELSWLSMVPTSGTITSGASQNINVKFNASKMNGGDYRQVVSINSNDPFNNPKNVPAKMHVIGVPAISVLPDTIKSGQVYVGVTRIDTLKVKNVGTDILNISNISSSIPVFTVDKTNFSMSPGQESVVAVTFTPTQDTTYLGSLSITSNDGRHPVVTVGLRGSGLYPPVITVTPDSFAVSLASGDSTTQTMTIGNSGRSPLNYTLVQGYRSPSLRVNSQPKKVIIRQPSPGTGNTVGSSNYPRTVVVSPSVSSPKILMIDAGLTENSGALDLLGYTYTKVTPSVFATTNLSSYDVLYVGWIYGSSTMTSSALQALYDRRVDIRNFVMAGGNLIALANIIDGSSIGWTWAPVAVGTQNGSTDNIHITNALHPIMDSLSDALLSNWSISCHSQFTSYDTSLKVLANAPLLSNLPVILAGNLGMGHVVLSGMDPDYHYYYNFAPGAGKLLRNMFTWLAKKGNWLSVTPTSGTVPPGSSQNVSGPVQCKKIKWRRLLAGNFN